MQLTSAELNVMTILWKTREPMSRDQICQSRYKSGDWKASTFYVILRGLKNKKTVREYIPEIGEEQYPERLFIPTISCEEYYAQLMAEGTIKINFKKLQQAYGAAARQKRKGEVNRCILL